ncbi:MAG: primosomal protein N' [Syntrophomonadaceae bacterium]
MKYVNILLDIPSLTPPPIYTYSCPEDSCVPGRRVLARLGAKTLEGWIISEASELPPGVQARPIVKVLDEEVYLNPAMLLLAQWISETYVCPLNLVLKAMLPAQLRSRDKLISLSPGEHVLNECSPSVRDFVKQLEKDGPLPWPEASQLVDEWELADLIENGLITIVSPRRIRKEADKDSVYVLERFDAALQSKLKRSPRQLEAMEYMCENGTINCRDLEKRYSRRAVAALVDKGYLKKEAVSLQIEPEYSLTSEQEAVLEELIYCLNLPRQETLLYGVTGSGKTEVYLRLAQAAINKGKTVIVLVPEIALTRHLTEVFKRRIPNMAVLHSRLTPGERRRLWAAISRGEVHLVLGTRLAVFAPLPELGLIIVDEEQENTFKQEESPRYHAREVARKRLEIEGGLLLLGSATPSLESYYRAVSGQIGLLHLPERPGQARLPVIEVEDMRKTPYTSTGGVLSPRLMDNIRTELAGGRQCILFINRRGYSPHTICHSCGQALLCVNCSVSLSYHRQSDKNRCHYCGFSQKPPAVCPACGSSFLQQQGIGTQRVEEEVRHVFPEARAARLDMDSSGKGRQQQILQQMARGEIDILIGTQMVAKGLDFPDVSLVGIVDADSLLNLPDFRSAERGFQLMVQAAGRAGRGAIAGKVLVQTVNPDHYAVQKAILQDFPGFFREEMAWRQALHYPPYTRILRVVVSALDEGDAWELAKAVFYSIEEALDSSDDVPEVLGPAPCPLARVRKRYRFQILVKSANILLLSSIGRYIINREKTAGGRIEIDVDPLVNM